MENYQELFQSHGNKLQLGGTKAFLVGLQNHICYLESGDVDFFVVQVKRHASRPIGMRYPLCRIERGNTFWVLDSEGLEDGLRLMMVATQNTKLLTLSQQEFHSLLQQTQHQNKAVAALENWILRFAEELAKNEITPKHFNSLPSGEKVSFEPKTYLSCDRGLQWVKPNSGRFLFMEKENLALSPQSPFFPVTNQTWVVPKETKERPSLTIKSTSSLVQQEDWFRSLQNFHQFSSALLSSKIQQQEEIETQGFHKNFEVKQHLVEGTLKRIGSFLQESKKERTFFLPDPLLAASQLIGDALEITIKPPPSFLKKEADPNEALSNRIMKIAKSSKIRFREVVLRKDWWKNDSGPLLATIEAEKIPVALLREKEGYILRNPASGEVKQVDAKVADTLAPFAYSFYRPFGREKLKALEVFKFGTLGCKQDFFIIFLMGIATGLLSLVTPIFTGVIFDEIIPESDQVQLLQLVFILVMIAFSTASFEITRNIALLRLEGKMGASVQAAVLDRLLRLPLSFFRQYSVGDLAQRTMGISQIRQILTGVVVSSILDSLFAVFSLGLLLYYDKNLALVAIALVLFAIFISSVASYFLLRIQRKVFELKGKISSIVLQFLNGVSKLRVSGTEANAFGIWAEKFVEQRRLSFKSGTIKYILSVFNGTFPLISTMIVFASVAFFLQSTESEEVRLLTTGSFIAFNAAFNNFLGAMLSLSSSMLSILHVVPIYERAKPILEATPEEDTLKSDPGDLKGKIEASHLTFAYPKAEKNILEDISFQINAGEFVAFVGPSGAGKSTLFRLLLNFESPQKGSLYYDDQALPTLDIQAVRSQIGVVLQSGKVTPGSIYKNIVGAASSLTLDDAWKAAEIASFADDIREMPMGMHTVISEGGVTLSGGQRQRLMIARAVALQPRILFFDEATSALDDRTQAMVTKSLSQLKSTRVVIAHRLSTIINADRIYVMERGKIVQQGSYQELSEQEGLFAELVRRQIL